MSLLGRLLTFIDNQTSAALDRHLEIALPTPRPSITPDEVISRYLPTRAQLELVGTFPCCPVPCCPPGCVDVHRDACDVHHTDGAA